jgi:signal transduction histidine kinase
VKTVNALLRRIEQAIGRERRFTGDAAHELRTPLTAVKTHIQVARLSGGGPDTDKALAHAEEGVRRLHGTIDQLLTLTRLDGPFSFDEGEPADAATIVQGVLEQISPADASRVEVLTVLDRRAIVRIPASLAMMALRNVLDNALRYSDGKAVALRLEVAAATVTFIVEDEGPGLAVEDIGHAAQRFWRKGRGHGSGLGLSIVDAIVTRHGGSWELARRARGGLTVRITLPRA